MGNLRIIADDMGLAGCVNDGISLALSNKWVDGASVMANGESFNDAVERMKDLSGKNIGAHIVLVEERPLSEAKNIPTLVDNKGYLFKNHKVFFIRYVLGLIALSDIEREVNSQLKKILVSGIRPRFINSHQHLHLLPGISSIFVKVAAENNIPYIRTVSEPFFQSRGGLFRKIQSLFLAVLSSLARRKIRDAGLETNDIFLGFSVAGNLGPEEINLGRMLYKRFPNKIIEIGCHPGREDSGLKARYGHWGSYHWRAELDLLERSWLTRHG